MARAAELLASNLQTVVFVLVCMGCQVLYTLVCDEQTLDCGETTLEAWIESLCLWRVFWI